jgi:hypothetical protein
VSEVRSLRPQAPLSSATGEKRAFFQAMRQKLCASQLYFMQLLMNLPSWPANDIDAWPDRWKKAHAARCEALEISPDGRASACFS